MKLTPQFLCRDTKSNTETSIIDVLEFQDTADTGIIEFNTPDFFSDDINYYNLTLELKQNNEIDRYQQIDESSDSDKKSKNLI